MPDEGDEHRHSHCFDCTNAGRSVADVRHQQESGSVIRVFHPGLSSATLRNRSAHGHKSRKYPSEIRGHGGVGEDGRNDTDLFAAMSAPRLLNLALQGGGAHGAFTWGVLDALLEDGRIAFDGLSGTSAGAMNAVVLAHGWMAGGRDGARAALRRFWTALADTMPLDVTRQDVGGGVHLAPAGQAVDGLGALRDAGAVQPAGRQSAARAAGRRRSTSSACARAPPFRLFVAATHADSGRLRVFGARELSVDAVLASGCLPTVFHAPRIDGQTYWDGGYAATRRCSRCCRAARSRDTLLVLLSPLEWPPTQPTRHGARAACARRRDRVHRGLPARDAGPRARARARGRGAARWHALAAARWRERARPRRAST